MEYNGILADYIFNLIVTAMWLAFLWRLLDGLRFSLPVTVIALIVLHTICFYFEVIIFPPSFIRSMLTPVEPLLLAFVLLRGKPLRKIFAVFLAVAISSIAEVFFSSFAHDLIRDDVIGVWADPRAPRLGFMMIPSVALLLFITSVFFANSKRVLRGKQLLIFAAFPLIQFFCILCIENLIMDSASSVYLIIVSVASVLFIISDIALYKMILEAEDRAQLEITNQLLSKQLDSQLAHYNALTEQYEKTRAIRHDISHHLNTIKILLNEGKLEEASEYADLLIPMQKYISHLGECQNPVVDAYVYNRIQDSEAVGISVESEIAIPASIEISNTDLICLFANIFDNAVEACSGTDKPKISIKAEISKGYLIVTETNPISQVAPEKAPRIPELERGIGFRILEDLAKRYDGKFEYSKSENSFDVRIMLKDTLSI